MSVLRMRLRAEMRARWRAWLLLALAFGLAGGAAMASAAGARRTASAYPRFLAAHNAAHLVTGGLGELDDGDYDGVRERLMALPQVAAASTQRFVTTTYELPDGREVSFPAGLVLGDVSSTELFEVDRAKVLAGRMFDPDAPDEAVTDLTTAQRFGLGVGDRVNVLLFDMETFRPTVPAPVTITGVVIAPGGLPAVGQVQLTGLTVSAAFIHANEGSIPPNEDGPNIVLKGGVEQIPEYIAAARAIAPNLDFPVELPRHVEGVQRTLRFDVAALWILAALIGLAATVMFGQALARHIAGEGESAARLRELGVSRGQLVAGDALRAAAIGVSGSLLAVVVAIALSPLTPRGLAGAVEPTPGVAADRFVLALGSVATLVLPVLLSIVPSLRSAGRRSSPVQRPSVVANWLAGAGATPSAVAGTRLALEAGRGARAVPVRSTIGGVALALAAFMAAVSFTQSLHTLISTPELYGFGWDVFAASEDPAGDVDYLAADPDVEVFSRGGYGNAVIDDRQVIPLVYQPGTIEPTILDGRAPTTDDEIALGNGLMRDMGVSVGDTIDVFPTRQGRGEQPGGSSFTVVGRVVVPPIFFQQVEPGETAAMTIGGYERMDPREVGTDYPLLIKYRHGVDVTTKIAQMNRDREGVFFGQLREPGAELAALSRSSDLPLVLTIALLAMGVGTLIHTLGSSIRKRRRDLAILKTIGFIRRQVRAAVTWQASTIAVIAVAIGVPAGLGAGRQAWRWFADALGVVPEPVSPLAVVVPAVLAGTLVLANVIAALPARAASRTQPALVFRSE